MKKLIITGNEAHFKIPMRSKIQDTYKIPTVSTVVGILQNIYGDDINDFEVGYFIEYEGVQEEILTIHKIDKNSKNRIKDLINLSNLYNVRLVIYHNINKEIEFESPLVLGKANYLAKAKFRQIELQDKQGFGINQYTPINIGNGAIERLNTITTYNESKGWYEYKTELFRENLEEFELDNGYDEEEDMNIYMWKWRDGIVS